MTPPREPVELSIIAGRADGFRAEIVVRAALVAAAGEGRTLRLTGTLTGPRRGRDMTLPTTVRLTAESPLERAGFATARAVFTEPAYWTPELPNLYRLEAKVSDGSDAVVEIDRLVGLRRFGVRGRSFWLDGRRWVPRGAGFPSDSPDLLPFRDLHAAAIVSDPPIDLAEAADRAGVAVVARLARPDGQPLETGAAVGRLAAWATHPSVMLATVPRSLPAHDAMQVAATVRGMKGTMLVGLEVDGAAPPGPVPDAFDFLVVSLPVAGLPHAGWKAWSHAVPLVAWRHGFSETSAAASSPAALRHECDRLQAGLALWGLDGQGGRPAGDWAGYLVTAW